MYLEGLYIIVLHGQLPIFSKQLENGKKVFLIIIYIQKILWKNGNLCYTCKC